MIDLHPHNWQRAFDLACEGLAEQGGPSRDAAGTCLYRGPNGRKCAIGWLIPDGEEPDGLELLPLGDLIPSESFRFADALQTAHDRRANVTAKDIRVALRAVANAYGLNPAAADLIRRWGP